MSPPLAYFLTWSTYGTRLHGDARGSVDRRHNRVDTPRLAPDPARELASMRRMRWPPLYLAVNGRAVVSSTVRRHCEIRGWRLLALNVRTNHVHVVVNCGRAVSPEKAMEQFKAWCTRRLREAGLVRPGRAVWTEHGSTRWINSEEGLLDAIDYVLNRQ